MQLAMRKTQLATFSVYPSSFPNNFRWKATGKMMQMLKQHTDPKSVMMRSKDGKTIEMRTKTIVTTIRIDARATLLAKLGIPPGGSRRPVMISMVETMGLAF